MSRYEIRVMKSNRDIQYKEFGAYEIIYAKSKESALDQVRDGLSVEEFKSIVVH